MNRIVVLGSANMDLVVRQPRWVQPGETMFGHGFSTGPGGKGLNQAIAAARAGAPVSFLGAVGGDAFGVRLRERLAADGVDTRRLRTAPGATGVAAITVTDAGENAIVVVPGANADESFGAADREAIRGAGYLVVQLERPEPLLREAMAYAREQGVTTVLTPAPARHGVGDLIALADIIVPNEGEATMLSGEVDAEAAAIALSAHGATVVVTRGGEGAVVARGAEIVHRVDAARVEAIDTTGAGDTFVGVLVAWLAGEASWSEALAAATLGAALAVSHAGAAEAAPMREEIIAFARGETPQTAGEADARPIAWQPTQEGCER